MKVLITGAGGQAGSSLVKSAPVEMNVLAMKHSALDITDRRAVARIISTEHPHVVINAAAYTAVDKAESERELAFQINGEGAENLAAVALQNGIRFIHISTDFVFDGVRSRPYEPEDTVNPLSAYGASKLEGERRVRDISGDRALIFRTAWVYAAEGANFVKTILRLMREHKALKVVYDQVGSPTWAMSLAQAIWGAVNRTNITGVHHWTDAGVASWYDFAVAIGEEATALGLLRDNPLVVPIGTEGYPTPARRPAYSVLDCASAQRMLDMRPEHWRVNLRKMLWELKDA